MKTEKNKLFEEFSAISVEEWEKKIAEDLKGADYEKKLIWKTTEGFSCKPYYTEADIQLLHSADSAPGEFPFVRTNRLHDNSWLPMEIINNPDISTSNNIALEAIQQGAKSLGFNARNISSVKDMAVLLNKIDVEKIHIHFLSSKSYPETFDLFYQYLEANSISPEKVHGSFNFDPFSYLLLHGNFYTTRENNFVEAKYLMESATRKLPHFSSITINGHLFHDSGSNIVQEIAFSLASASDYLSGLSDKGIDAGVVARNFLFSFSTASDYFLEIAKIRAARLLWSAIVAQYSPSSKADTCMKIHSRTSMLNKTLYDPHVNMLRVTTEAMASVLGGADYISVTPFDAAYKNSDSFSRRISMNVQNILSSEAYLDKVIDPSAGSYYIESLTNNIASAAWNLFKTIESKGGFASCILDNYIQELIEDSCKKRNMDIATRKQVILGTNQYPNLNETMLEKIENIELLFAEKYAAVKNPICKRINQYRGAYAFEKLRLNTEKYVKSGKKRPKVFLLTIGNLAMRKARAMFSTNFFGCAGYIIQDNLGFSTPEDGIEAALKSSSEFVVICSSDDEYALFGSTITKTIKEKSPETKVIIAGNPISIIDSLKADGVDEFIHIRSNVLETLQKFNLGLGIN